MLGGTLYRLCEDPFWHEVDHWPTPQITSWTLSQIECFERREKAIRLWFDRECLEYIEQQTGIQRKEVYQLLKRAFTYRTPDEIWGFVALKPYARIKAYERKTSSDRGCAGQWSQFIRQYPELDEFIIDTYLGKREQRKKGRRKRPRRPTFVDVLGELQEEALKIGLTLTDYPFSLSDGGLECVRRHCHTYFNADTAREVIGQREGKQAAQIWDASGPSNPDALKFRWRPYERVQLDEHELNLFMTIETWTPEGICKPLTLERCWLIVLIDTVSRAILSYHLSINQRYTSNDVRACIRKSYEKWSPVGEVNPFTNYHPEAGLPSGVLPNCEARLFDELALDNCKTHVSPLNIERIMHVGECSIVFGEGGAPITRAIVESFFDVFCHLLTDRMPSNAGRNPSDIRRRGEEHKGEVIDVRLDEIYTLIDVVCANRNADRTHSALGGISPLDTIRRYDEQFGTLPRYLHKTFRKRNPLCFRLETRVVQGLSRHCQPYIQYMAVKYHGRFLCDLVNPGRPKCEVTIEINDEDLRKLRVYSMSGEVLGDVRADGEWGELPHDLQMRRTINKLRSNRQLQVDPTLGSIISYQRFVETRAAESKRARKTAAKLRLVMNECLDPPSWQTVTSSDGEDYSMPDFEALTTFDKIY